MVNETLKFEDLSCVLTPFVLSVHSLVGTW